MCSPGSFTFALKKENVTDSETPPPHKLPSKTSLGFLHSMQTISIIFSIGVCNVGLLYHCYIDDNIWAESVAGLLWNSLCSPHRQPHVLHIYNKADFYFEQ